MLLVSWCFFFFKQKTAYEMRISDWSSDVCSSDLLVGGDLQERLVHGDVVTDLLEPAGDGALRDALAELGEHDLAALATTLRGLLRGRRSEERRVGKSVSVRVDLGGRRIIKNKTKITTLTIPTTQRHYTKTL